eukprot:1417889-Rhodomonas_salina.1
MEGGSHGGGRESDLIEGKPSDSVARLPVMPPHAGSAPDTIFHTTRQTAALTRISSAISSAESVTQERSDMACTKRAGQKRHGLEQTPKPGRNYKWDGSGKTHVSNSSKEQQHCRCAHEAAASAQSPHTHRTTVQSHSDSGGVSVNPESRLGRKIAGRVALRNCCRSTLRFR